MQAESLVAACSASENLVGLRPGNYLFEGCILSDRRVGIGAPFVFALGPSLPLILLLPLTRLFFAALVVHLPTFEIQTPSFVSRIRTAEMKRAGLGPPLF